jgi:TonB family protein
VSGAGATWNMDVTDVLRDRAHEPSGLQTMLVVSIAVHVVAFAGFLLAPAGWLASQPSQDPGTIMTISLGSGGDGPQSGGLTTMGGRAIQAPAPEPARPEPVRAPAAVAPEMTVPVPAARARPSSPDAKQAPPDARGRTPTRGAETRAGSTIAETGIRGQGFGLSSGGGPGVGASLDVGDFCCPDYILTMVQRITRNWNQRQNVTGLTTVKFTIRRDGVLQDIVLEQSSNFPIADLAAQRAVVLTARLPELPGAFPNPTLTVHLHFQYQR